MKKRIPIKDAKDFATVNELDQVIILGWSKTTGLTHVVTYGKTVTDCVQAAEGGNKVKRVLLGWPEALCNAKPKRTDSL